VEPSPETYRQFEALVLEHHVRVRAFVRSLGVDRDWVDDIAQEAFMVAFREWTSFDSSRDFGRWVRGIAANLVRNEVRKRARQQRILHAELTYLLLNRQSDAARDASPILVSAIRACLARLSPGQLALVHGRYRDGLSAAELADRAGKSADAVRQILTRIRRDLRACVQLRAAGAVRP
jgi:RNA polymerase sigma-70 factor (ECF subfamily)